MQWDCCGSKVNAMKRYKIIIMCFVIICLINYLSAAFENPISGARPCGLGNAFTGLADDIQAIFYNPAGLSQIRHKEFITYYGKPFMGLDDKSDISEGFVGYVHPIRGRESIAISLSDLRLSSMYNENIASVSYAKDFSKKISLGCNLKVLKVKYGSDSYTEIDPIFDRQSKTSFSSDAGLFVKFTNRVSLGISVLDINEPDIGIGENVFLPIRTRVGLGLYSKFATVCMDVEKQKDDFKFFLGSEKPFFTDKFYLREGIGYGKDFFNISLGFSILPDPMKIDYAYQLPIVGVKDVMGTHRISIVFEFGKEIHDPYTKDLESEIDKLQKERDDLQKNLKTTSEQLQNTSADMEKTKTELEEIQKQKEQLEIDKRRLEYRPPVKQVTYHTVEKGDTLASISQKYYGTPDKWQNIYDANKNKIERGMPVVGTQLVIP
jgi:LysM repeat protein